MYTFILIVIIKSTPYSLDYCQTIS